MKHEVHDQVKKAEAEITGMRLCFNCGKQRPAKDFRSRMIGMRRFWKCGACATKSNPAGFKE